MPAVELRTVDNRRFKMCRWSWFCRVYFQERRTRSDGRVTPRPILSAGRFGAGGGGAGAGAGSTLVLTDCQVSRKPGEMRVAFGEREEIFLPQVTVARVQRHPTGSMRKMSVCRVGSSREELGWSCQQS